MPVRQRSEAAPGRKVSAASLSNMGRPPKYGSEEERREAHRKQTLAWYRRHRAKANANRNARRNRAAAIERRLRSQFRIPPGWSVVNTQTLRRPRLHWMDPNGCLQAEEWRTAEELIGDIQRQKAAGLKKEGDPHAKPESAS
jgi:hypothetical protein